MEMDRETEGEEGEKIREDSLETEKEREVRIEIDSEIEIEIEREIRERILISLLYSQVRATPLPPLWRSKSSPSRVASQISLCLELLCSTPSSRKKTKRTRGDGDREDYKEREGEKERRS